MPDLKQFQEKVTIYRKKGYNAEGRQYTQAELANEIGLSAKELGHRLNGNSRSPLTQANILKIVVILAKWGKLSWEEAIELLTLMDYPLASPHWKMELQRFLSPLAESAFLSPAERQQSAKKLARLRSIRANENGFRRNRLGSFVGRQVELAHIRQHIEALLPTGGYLTIIGLAGQGKSSIIAKLVDEHHVTNSIHHFIPPNPGLDYQVSLLRDLLAQLILKHDELPEFFIASENRVVLRDYFSNVLMEISTLRRQEVIFIDGLDQLMEDYNGERDLSFLPITLPVGIVFVIGTRPDDSQKPLQMRKPSIEYQLPNLKREDFELILGKRGIALSTVLADQIYQVMQQNALFLSLAANELVEDKKVHPEEIIRRVADNPEDLFTLSMDRLGRTRRSDPLWSHVLKPILGILLAAREPLTQGQIRRIINIDADYLKGGLRRLRGLLVIDGQQRYSLFHQKLYDYLRQDQNNPDRDHIFDIDEEEGWHKILANWCESNNLSVIWKDARDDFIEQERREYARKYYITHLYYAKDWSRLFAVLDEGNYGQAKVHSCSMASAYAQDLNLGRQAAIQKDWTLQEGINHLPHLWRYTLLLSSLNSRADHYPSELFQLLSALNQIQRALDLAELLTDPLHKASVLLQIAPYLISSASGNRHLLLNAQASALLIEEPLDKVWTLTKVVTAFIKNQQWRQAEEVIYSIKEAISIINEKDRKFEGYIMLFIALSETHQWEQANIVCTQIESMIQSQNHKLARISGLKETIASLVKLEQWEHATKLTSEAERILGSVEDSENDLLKDMALEKVAISFANVQQWKRAEEMACLIKWSGPRARALKEIAIALLEFRQWDQAYRLGGEAEKAARTANDSTLLIETLSVIAEALTEMQQWDQVNAISINIENIAFAWADLSHDESDGRSLAAEALAKVQQWERAEKVARLVQNKQKQARALSIIAIALLSVKQQERANMLAMEAEKIAVSIKEDFGENEIICGIVRTLAEVQQWEQAEKVADSLQPDFLRVRALSAISGALVKAQQRERAHLLTKKSEEAARSIKVPYTKIPVIAEVTVNFARMQQWEDASRLAAEAEEAARSLETPLLRFEV